MTQRCCECASRCTKCRTGVVLVQDPVLAYYTGQDISPRVASYMSGPTINSDVFFQASATVVPIAIYIGSDWQFVPRTSVYGLLSGSSRVLYTSADPTPLAPIYWDKTAQNAADAATVRTWVGECTTTPPTPSFAVSSGKGIVLDPNDAVVGTAVLYFRFNRTLDTIREVTLINIKDSIVPVAGYYTVKFQDIMVPMSALDVFDRIPVL